MTNVQNPPIEAPPASWAVRGLVEELMPRWSVDRAPGDVAWYPPAADGAKPRPVSRAAVYELIAAAVTSGASAPVLVEFTEYSSGPQLEVVLADNDRAAVTIFSALFGLPLPVESGFKATNRRRLGPAQLFGSSTTRPSRFVAQGEAVPGLAQAMDQSVSVYCYVPWVEPAVGVARVAPAVTEVIA